MRGVGETGCPWVVERVSCLEMIRLTRLNNREFVLNCEMIQYLEQTPDTVVTLSNREKIVVKENVDEVLGRVIEYHRAIRTFRVD